MGIILVKCPQTGRAISTGMEMDQSRFNRIPVFFGRTFCPTCRKDHEWFARDAWVWEPRPDARISGLQPPGHGDSGTLTEA
jgi:hypothetical protein